MRKPKFTGEYAFMPSDIIERPPVGAQIQYAVSPEVAKQRSIQAQKTVREKRAAKNPSESWFDKRMREAGLS